MAVLQDCLIMPNATGFRQGMQSASGRVQLLQLSQSTQPRRDAH